MLAIFTQSLVGFFLPEWKYKRMTLLVHKKLCRKRLSCVECGLTELSLVRYFFLQVEPSLLSVHFIHPKQPRWDKSTDLIPDHHRDVRTFIWGKPHRRQRIALILSNLLLSYGWVGNAVFSVWTLFPAMHPISRGNHCTTPKNQHQNLLQDTIHGIFWTKLS